MIRPDWPQLLLACIADHDAGAKTFPEFIEHRARKAELVLVVGSYADAKGYPLVLVNNWEIGGAAAWCDFLAKSENPELLGEALLELDP